MNTKYIQYNLQEIQEEIEIIFEGLKKGDLSQWSYFPTDVRLI